MDLFLGLSCFHPDLGLTVLRLEHDSIFSSTGLGFDDLVDSVPEGIIHKSYSN